MEITLTQIGPYLSGGFLAALTWILGRRQQRATTRKTNAEAAEKELDGVSIVISMWKEAAQEFQRQVKLLTGEVNGLRKENMRLSNRLESLERHWQDCADCPMRIESLNKFPK